MTASTTGAGKRAIRSARRAPPFTISRAITLAESNGQVGSEASGRIAALIGGAASTAPVLGVTGTGGSGKSSLVDELVRRYVEAHPERTVAILAVDGRRAVRRIDRGGGYLSSRDALVRFGLGSTAHAARLTIVGPDGSEEVFDVPGVDRVLSVARGDGTQP